MTLRNATIADLERLQSQADERDVPFEMDEDTFRAFYDRTARPLWAYLSRVTRDPNLADDLLQETYYRFLRARVALDGEVHRRNYLFRVATNLLRDRLRRQAARPEKLIDIDVEQCANVADADTSIIAERRADLSRAMDKLKPRERQMLWLAYAQGSSHREIGEALGLKTGSIKPLLFRARGKLASLLRGTRNPGGTRRED
jgi:RNA polymerase sigma-70 factor, ECF subfamily